MAYVALSTLHNPTSGTNPTVAWGDQIHDNFTFLRNPPRASAFNAAVEITSQTTTSWTTLSAGTEAYDTDGMHSTVTNPSRFTCVTAGTYLVAAVVNFETNSTGHRGLRFLLNGTTAFGGLIVPTVASGSVETVLSSSRSLALAAGDYVEVQVQQNSGGGLDCRLDEFRIKWDGA